MGTFSQGISKGIFQKMAPKLVQVFGLNSASKMICRSLELIEPRYKVKARGLTLELNCPNEFARWRAETFLQKEPETLDWIDGFHAGDVLLDIGANLGLYSLYAGKKGVRVLAFEPESQNYATLNKNIYINQLGHLITAYNLALSNTLNLNVLSLSKFQTGAALHQFAQTKEHSGAFQQGVMGMSLDWFLEHFQGTFPTHIKIDVDGLEAKIVEGAQKTLADSRLKSVLIELDEKLPQDLEIVQIMKEQGFVLQRKAQSPMFKNSEYGAIYNHIFVRPAEKEKST